MGESNENQNIPSFISQSPWYAKDEVKSPKKPSPGLSLWYTKGAKIPTKSLKFRKGACTNCGSISHTMKNCCERPRKIGAKHTGLITSYDEVVEKIDLNYDAKHDRWNGYDPEMYSSVIQDYEKLENAKKKIKIEKLEETLYKDKEIEISDGEHNEEYAHSQMINNIDPRTKTITINNRVREDVACYLHNLDPSSNNYDGKSRSYKEIDIGIGDQDQLYRDSWVKTTGDMVKMVKQENFIQKLIDKGNDLHSLANPSQSELLFKWYEQEKSSLETKIQSKLLDRYGDQKAFEIQETDIEIKK
jgi:pre-mRNA-processing factor SLU7